MIRLLDGDHRYDSKEKVPVCRLIFPLCVAQHTNVPIMKAPQKVESAVITASMLVLCVHR